jgi:hypothetical protein
VCVFNRGLPVFLSLLVGRLGGPRRRRPGAPWAAMRRRQVVWQVARAARSAQAARSPAAAAAYRLASTALVKYIYISKIEDRSNNGTSKTYHAAGGAGVATGPVKFVVAALRRLGWSVLGHGDRRQESGDRWEIGPFAHTRASVVGVSVDPSVVGRDWSPVSSNL